MIRYDHPVVNLYMEAAWWYHTLVVTSLKWRSESHPLDLWMVRFMMVDFSASMMPFCGIFFPKATKHPWSYELPRLKLRLTKLYSILLDGTLDDHPIISRNLLPICSYVLISKSVGFAKHSDFGYVTTDSLHMGAGWLNGLLRHRNCWWKKSCTTWDV